MAIGRFLEGLEGTKASTFTTEMKLDFWQMNLISGRLIGGFGRNTVFPKVS
jgi:hypothetical protein